MFTKNKPKTNYNDNLKIFEEPSYFVISIKKNTFYNVFVFEYSTTDIMYCKLSGDLSSNSSTNHFLG